MGLESLVREDVLTALRSLETCVVSNAIQAFEVRLRNTGFADASIRYLFEDFPPHGRIRRHRTSSQRGSSDVGVCLPRPHRLVEQHFEGSGATSGGFGRHR
jgi:hypothetical protein